MRDVFPHISRYKVSDRNRFGGRDYEQESLLWQIEDRKFTVVYGRSGVGKSSLIRAGLARLLDDKKYKHVVIDGFDVAATNNEFDIIHRFKQDVVRKLLFAFRYDPRLKDAKYRSYIDSCIGNKKKQHQGIATGDLPKFSREPSLYELVHFLTDETSIGGIDGNRIITPPKLVLVLDQFEEVFYKHREAVEKRYEEVSFKNTAEELEIHALGSMRTFIQELGDLAENRTPNIIMRKGNQLPFDSRQHNFHVVFCAREEYFPDLEKLQYQIDSFWVNSIQIKPLTYEQAIDAFKAPLDHVNKVITEENKKKRKEEEEVEFTNYENKLDEILQELSKNERIAFGSELGGYKKDHEYRLKEYFPQSLSIYGSRLVEQIKESRDFTNVNIEEFGLDRAIKDHYQEALQAAAIKSNSKAEDIHKAMEQLLTSSDNHWDWLHKDDFAKVLDLANDNEKLALVVNSLTESRVLQTKIDGNNEKYGLIHDVYVRPIADEKKEREEREAKDERKLYLLKIANYVLIGSILVTLVAFMVINFVYEERRDASNFIVAMVTEDGDNPNVKLSASRRFKAKYDADAYLAQRIARVYTSNRFYKNVADLQDAIRDFEVFDSGNGVFVGSGAGIYGFYNSKAEPPWREAGVTDVTYLDSKGDMIPEPVQSVALSTDERVFAIGTMGGYLYIGDVESGKVENKYPLYANSESGRKVSIQDLVFSNDGKYLYLSVDDHANLERFDIKSGEIGKVEWSNGAQQDRADESPYYKLCSNDDGTKIYGCSRAGVRVWNLVNNETRSLPGIDGRVLDVDYYKEQLLLALAGGKSSVYDLEENTITAQFDQPAMSMSNAWSADGKYQLIGSEEGRAALWLHDDCFDEFITGQRSRLRKVGFGPDNTQIYTAGEDMLLRKWSTSGKMLSRWQGKPVTTEGVLTSNTGFVNYDEDEQVLKAYQKEGEFDTLLLGDVYNCVMPTVVPGTQMVPVAITGQNNEGWYQEVRLLNAESLEWEPESFYSNTEEDYWVTGLLHHPDKEFVLMHYYGKHELGVYDLQQKEHRYIGLENILEGGEYIYSWDISYQGDYLVVGTTKSRVLLLALNEYCELTAHKVLPSHYADALFISAGFSPRGDWIYSFTKLGATIQLQETTGAQLIELTLPVGFVVNFVRYTDDANRLLVGYENGYAHVWDVGQQSIIQEMKVINKPELAAIDGCVNEDATMSVLCSDGHVRTWEARTHPDDFKVGVDYEGLSADDKKRYRID